MSKRQEKGTENELTVVWGEWMKNEFNNNNQYDSGGG